VRKILLLANPLFKSRCGRDLPQIVRVFEQAGAQVEILETGANRAAGGKATRAAEQGVDAVIVCGGDGTVFDVLQGLAGSDVPLGIVPFGTGNILAQNLKIPKNPVQAARSLLNAKPRSVPLGKITCCLPGGQQTWFFAMSAGMGLHAAIMESARRSQKDRTGKAAYFAAGFKALFAYPIQPFDLEITTVQEQVLKRQACEIIAVRVAELNIWRPGGDLSSPFLRLASVEGESRWQIAKAAFDAFFPFFLGGVGQRNRRIAEGAPARYEDVVRVICRPIAGKRYQMPISVQADGEVLGAFCATIEMAGVNLQLLSADN
jgi:diacylglycerol kinase (ATP)